MESLDPKGIRVGYTCSTQATLLAPMHTPVSDKSQRQLHQPLVASSSSCLRDHRPVKRHQRKREQSDPNGTSMKTIGGQA